MKAEVTPSNSSSSWPLLLLLVKGLGWLVVSGILALVASIQVQDPSFMAGCPVFTYGRTSAMAETAFVYGWLANAGLALVLFTLGRLAGEPLRAQNWAIGGAIFWNLGVLGALVGIGVGDATGFALLGLPKYVQLLLFASYAAIAVPGSSPGPGACGGSPTPRTGTAAAALFLFPWLLSIAHVMLFSAPVRGVLQPIVAGWYAQSAWTLWLAPMALSAAYYVVPKVTGKACPSYEFAALGFWCLIFVGGLTGGRHLLGGPVPAWIPSVAVVSCALLLFQILVVLLNLRGAFFGRGVSLKFIAFGLAAYALGAAVDALTSFHAVAAHTQFTYFDEAQRQVALYGAASTILIRGDLLRASQDNGEGLALRRPRAHPPGPDLRGDPPPGRLPVPGRPDPEPGPPRPEGGLRRHRPAHAPVAPRGHRGPGDPAPGEPGVPRQFRRHRVPDHGHLGAGRV